MARGIFITLEGPEGAGKSSQKEAIATFLRRQGHEVVITREPGGTPLAEEIREVLLRPRDESVNTSAELLLMFAARAQHIEQVIRPAIARGAAVICDRYIDSSYAYQAGGRQLSYKRITRLVDFIAAPTPDLVLFFDVDVETGLRRASKRGALDRMEGEALDFYRRVADMYRYRRDLEPLRYWTIDGNLTYDQIWPQIEPIMKRVDLWINGQIDQVIES